MYPPVEETAIPPPQALTIPVGMPPIAWMACMGINGEEPNFIDFNNLNLTQTQAAPTSLVRNITRGYMASVSYVDQQVFVKYYQLLSKCLTPSVSSAGR